MEISNSYYYAFFYLALIVAHVIRSRYLSKNLGEVYAMSFNTGKKFKYILWSVISMSMFFFGIALFFYFIQIIESRAIDFIQRAGLFALLAFHINQYRKLIIAENGFFGGGLYITKWGDVKNIEWVESNEPELAQCKVDLPEEHESLDLIMPMELKDTFLKYIKVR